MTSSSPPTSKSTPKFVEAGSSGEFGWHATELAIRCPRFYAYQYRMGPHAAADTVGERADSPSEDALPLVRGTLGHAGMAQFYRRMQAWQHGEDPEEWATVSAGIDEAARRMGNGPIAREMVPLIKRAMAAYVAKFGGVGVGSDAALYDVVDVENIVTAEIDANDGGVDDAPPYPPFNFTQRLDLVWRRKSDGKHLIPDHKFVGRWSATTPRRYVLSGQFLGMQSFGRRLYGKDFGGVLINGISLQNVDRGELPTFHRVIPDPAPEALLSFPLTVLHARRRIADLDRSGLPPSSWPMALSEQTCITAYGPCPHFERCRWGSP